MHASIRLLESDIRFCGGGCISQDCLHTHRTQYAQFVLILHPMWSWCICMRSGCQVPILVGLFALAFWAVNRWQSFVLIYNLCCTKYILCSCSFPLRKSFWAQLWLLVFLLSMPQCLYDLWIRRFDADWLSSTKIPDLHRSTRNRSYPLFRSSWPVWHFCIIHSPLLLFFRIAIAAWESHHKQSTQGSAELIICCLQAQLDIRLPFDPWDDRLSPGKAVRCKSVESCWVIVFLSLTREADTSFTFETFCIYHCFCLVGLQMFCCIENVTIYFEAKRNSLFVFVWFFLEIRPDLVTWAQRKAVSDCRHTAMSWLLCRTCALQTHAPKWLLRLSSHEADLQWCCLHHFDELRPQRYPGSMFRLQTSKFGSGNMRTQHSSACNEHEEKEHWNAMCYCCTLYTVSPTSIESIPYTSIYLPCTFLLLRWLSCSQTSGAVPADLAQSTARSLASDLLEGLSAQQRSYSEPSGPIFLLQRKRLTCSTFTMSSPTARRWRFHLDNPWYSRHNIKTSSNNINHPKFSW